MGHAIVLPVKEEIIKRDGRHARAERTHQAIVSALLDLADLGNLAPTAQQIAERAGVAVRSIRQHFVSRESLFLAAAAEHARRSDTARTIIVTDGKLPARIAAFAYQRAAALESTSTLRHAATLAESNSAAITRAMSRIGRARRREVETAFGRELDQLAKSERKLTLDALDVATSGRTWDALRRDMKLSTDHAREVLEFTIAKLV